MSEISAAPVFCRSLHPKTQDRDGFSIGRERITRELKERTGFLDLGQLGLTALPEELLGLWHLQWLNLRS
jgi:hypothetical protein